MESDKRITGNGQNDTWSDEIQVNILNKFKTATDMFVNSIYFHMALLFT